MSKLIAFTSLTLDGVMQAPGRPDEDARGGFEHGGWAIPYADSVLGTVSGESMASTGALVFGRRTYEDFYAVWPKRPDNAVPTFHVQETLPAPSEVLATKPAAVDGPE